jgi:hypothetical protein
LRSFRARSANRIIGGHAFDSSRGLIYAQVPVNGQTATSKPLLQVVDSDNLTVREVLQLRENLAGKALLHGDNMYAISDSGITVLPVQTCPPFIVCKQFRRICCSWEAHATGRHHAIAGHSRSRRRQYRFHSLDHSAGDQVFGRLGNDTGARLDSCRRNCIPESKGYDSGDVADRVNVGG